MPASRKYYPDIRQHTSGQPAGGNNDSTKITTTTTTNNNNNDNNNQVSRAGVTRRRADLGRMGSRRPRRSGTTWTPGRGRFLLEEASSDPWERQPPKVSVELFPLGVVVRFRAAFTEDTTLRPYGRTRSGTTWTRPAAGGGARAPRAALVQHSTVQYSTAQYSI